MLADAADAQAQLDDVSAKADKLDGDAIKMRFKLDSADGRAQLDAIKAKADEMGFKDVNIKVRVDGKGRAIAELEAIKREADAASGGGGGLLGGLLSGISGAGSALPLVGGLGPAAIPALAGGLAALLPEVVAVGSGFAAAGAGAGAFALLALPAVKKVEEALKDTPAKLAKLNLSRDESGAVAGIRSLGTEFGKISKAFQPQAFRIFNDGLKVANSLLPAVTPMATAFGNALHPLLQQLNGFTQSAGFQNWLKQFTALIGPATAAIGHGLGGVVNEFGKLLTIFSGKDVANGINIAFGVIKGAIQGVIVVVRGLKAAWDSISQTSTFKRLAADFAQAWHSISATGKKKPDFSGLVNAVKDAVSTAVGFLNSRLAPLINGALKTASNWLSAHAGTVLYPIGVSIMKGLIRGLESQLPSLLGVLSKVAIFIAEHKGPIEKDRVLLVPAGKAIMQGLMAGIDSERPALGHQLAGVTRDISASVRTGGRSGGGDVHLHINFNGVVGDKYAVAQLIHQTMRDYKRNRGNAPLGLS